MSGAAWQDFLLEGTYAGIRFDFIATREEHGRDLDKRRLPGRDGAELEDRARNELAIAVKAIFIEDDYPDTLNKLLDVIDNQPGPHELIHPVFGSIQAIAERATVVHDADDAIDCATMDITFTEHTENLGPFQAVDTLAALFSAVSAAADTVTFDAALVMPDYPSSNTSALKAVLDAMNAANALMSGGDYADQSIAEIQAIANVALMSAAGAASTISAAANGDPSAAPLYDLYASVIAMGAAFSRFSDAIAESRPPLITDVLDQDWPLPALAFAYYADSSRAAELLALNVDRIDDPLLLPAGLEIRRYAA